MAYIKNKNTYKIGDVVITKRVHSSMAGTFTKGSNVKIVDIDPVRGYAIQDDDGNYMCEIGWEI